MQAASRHTEASRSRRTPTDAQRFRAPRVGATTLWPTHSRLRATGVLGRPLLRRALLRRPLLRRALLGARERSEAVGRVPARRGPATCPGRWWGAESGHGRLPGVAVGLAAGGATDLVAAAAGLVAAGGTAAPGLVAVGMTTGAFAGVPAAGDPVADAVGAGEAEGDAEADGDGDAEADGDGVTEGDGVALGCATTGGGGAHATVGAPITDPSDARRKTGFGAGTIPNAMACAANACGAARCAIDCVSACSSSAYFDCSIVSVCTVNDPCASQVLTSSTITSPPPSRTETSRTKGARGAVARGRTTRSGGAVRVGGVAGSAELRGADGSRAPVGAAVVALAVAGLTPPPAHARLHVVAPKRCADSRRSPRRSRPQRHG